MAVRRKRIDSAYRDASLADLQALVIAIDPETNRQAWSATLRLCERFALTAYDAAHLELAQRRQLPLATLDVALARAARAENVPLMARDEPREFGPHPWTQQNGDQNATGV